MGSRQINAVHRPQEAGGRVWGACTDLLNPYKPNSEGFVPGGPAGGGALGG